MNSSRTVEDYWNRLDNGEQLGIVQTYDNNFSQFT